MEGARARAVGTRVGIVAVGLAALLAIATQPTLDDLFLQLPPSCHRDAPLYLKRCAVTWINLICVSVAKVEDSWYVGLAFRWLRASQGLKLGRLMTECFTFAGTTVLATVLALYHFLLGALLVPWNALSGLFVLFVDTANGASNLFSYLSGRFCELLIYGLLMVAALHVVGAFVLFALFIITVTTFTNLLVVPWNALSGLFVDTANGTSNLFSGLYKLLLYGSLIVGGLGVVGTFVKMHRDDYRAVSQINALMEPLALNDIEKELNSASRYLMNPNINIAFMKRDLSRVLTELDAILTDGLPDARQSKREYSQQITRILKRIRALEHR